MSFKSILILAVACSISSSAWAASTITAQDKQQAACANDVQKLCADTVPDMVKTQACMKAHRAEVSPGCAKMFNVKK